MREEKRREEQRKRDSNAGLALSESRCQSRSDLFMRRYERVKVCERVRERKREREREKEKGCVLLCSKDSGNWPALNLRAFFFLLSSLFSFLLISHVKILERGRDGGRWLG